MAKKKKAAAPAATPQTAFDKYKASGFYQSANIPALQEQLAKYNVSQADARKQAQAQLAPTYNMQKTQFQNQLSQLNVQRNRDIQNLNNQYNKSLNSVMTGLNNRNMGRSSLVSTKGVEVENARNAAISDTSFQYLQKENEINANRQQAEAEYAQSVENKAVEIANQNQAQYLTLLAQIAQLQQGGYSAYINYQLNK